MDQYKKYLLTKAKNNDNTTSKALIFIKNMLNKILKERVIDKNPVESYSIERRNGNREFLTPEELESLQNLYNRKELKPHLQNVLQYFLFSCYTGLQLRYQDIYNFRFSDFIDRRTIRFKMDKVKEYVTIPLIQDAINLVPEEKLVNQKVFRVIANQSTYKALKKS